MLYFNFCLSSLASSLLLQIYTHFECLKKVNMKIHVMNLFINLIANTEKPV